MIYTAKDGKKFTGTQRGRRYDDMVGKDDTGNSVPRATKGDHSTDAQDEGTQGKGTTGRDSSKVGGHLVQRQVTRDDSPGATHGLPKVPTSDPMRKGDGAGDRDGEQGQATEANVNPKVEPDGADSAPGGKSWESDLREHGMAREIVITHDSTGSHVKATHADGYTHESHHIDSVQAHNAARTLGGVTEEMEPQETPQTRARNYPVGPKEEKRMHRENQGMGIKHEGGIPGLAN